MPGDLNYTVFGVGGGEAVDLAIKLARGYSGKQKIVSLKGGYHGHTGLALATGDEQYRAPFGKNSPVLFKYLLVILRQQPNRLRKIQRHLLWRPFRQPLALPSLTKNICRL